MICASYDSPLNNIHYIGISMLSITFRPCPILLVRNLLELVINLLNRFQRQFSKAKDCS